MYYIEHCRVFIVCSGGKRDISRIRRSKIPKKYASTEDKPNILIARVSF